MTQLILDVEYAGVTSFHGVMELCALATRLGICVRTEVFRKQIIAAPNDDPNHLYKGLELIDRGKMQEPITKERVDSALTAAERNHDRR
jgi:hypothetical protein